MSCECESTGSGDVVMVAGALVVVGASAASAVSAFLAIAPMLLLIAGYLAALLCIVLAAAALVWRHLEHHCLDEPAPDELPSVGPGIAGHLEAGSLSSLVDVIEVDGVEVDR